jgi:hypothetical protein
MCKGGATFGGMEPNTTKRLVPYTATCKAAAQAEFSLLSQIEAILSELAVRVGVTDDDARTLLNRAIEVADQRHLWCVSAGPSVEEIEPITSTTHRQWLRPPHPLALASWDVRRKHEACFVGDFVPEPEKVYEDYRFACIEDSMKRYPSPPHGLIGWIEHPEGTSLVATSGEVVSFAPRSS